MHRIAFVFLTVVLLGCGGGGSGSTGGGGGGGSSDPVDLILNGATKASATHHWDSTLSGLLDNGYAFFADGTGAFSGRNSSQDFVAIDFTWVKNGPASLTIINAPVYLGFSNLSFILGSVGSGEFLAQLDGNPAFRTFVLHAGGLPGATGGAGQGTVFVVDQSDTSVRVFDRQTLTQIRAFSGGNTELSVPAGIAVDGAAGEIYVSNVGSNAIVVHAIGASGNVAPLRRISGPATGLGLANCVGGLPPISGIAVDAANAELIVVNGAPPSITVFSQSASGDVAPLRTIEGAATGLVCPVSVAVDPTNGEIFVGDGHIGEVRVFSRTATGNVAPVRVLGGGGFGGDADGIALDIPAGELWTAQGHQLNVFARTAAGGTPPLRGSTPFGPWTGVAIDSSAGDWVACSRAAGSTARLEIFFPSLATKLFKDVGGQPMGVALGP